MSEIKLELAESKRKVLQILERNDQVTQDLQYTMDDIKSLKNDSEVQMKELEEMSKEFLSPPVPLYSELLQTHTSRKEKATKYTKQFKKWFRELNKRERKLTVQTERDIVTRRNYNRLAVKLNDMKAENRKLRADRNEMIYALEQWQELLLDKDQALVSTLKREEIHVKKLRFKLAIYQIEDERRAIAIRNIFEEFKDYGVKDFKKHYDQCIVDLELERQFYQKLDKKFNSVGDESSDPWEDFTSGKWFENENSLGGWRLNEVDLKRKQFELQEFSRILLNKGIKPGFEGEYSKMGEVKILEDYHLDVLLRGMYVRKKMFRGEKVEEVDTPEAPFGRDRQTLSEIMEDINLVEGMTEKFDKKLIEQNFVMENLENGNTSILTRVHQRDHSIRRLEQALQNIEDELSGGKAGGGKPKKEVSFERRHELEGKRDGFTKRLEQEIKTKRILVKLHQKQKQVIREHRTKVAETENKLLCLAQKRVNLNEQKFVFLGKIGDDDDDISKEITKKGVNWKELVKQDELFDMEVENEEKLKDEEEKELEKQKEEKNKIVAEVSITEEVKKKQETKGKSTNKKKGPAKKEREGESSEEEEEVEGESESELEEEETEGEVELDDEGNPVKKKRKKRKKKKGSEEKVELTEEEKNREEFKSNLKVFVKSLRRPSTSLGVANNAVVREERVLNLVDMDKMKEESKKKVFPKPLLKKIRSFESLSSMKEKRMDLMKEYYKARGERVNSIVGGGSDIPGEIETSKLINELEQRIIAQKEYIQNLKDLTDKDWAREKNQEALKVFSGDEKYQKIKFLRRHKYCQTTPLNISQSVQATANMVAKNVQAGKTKRKRRRTAVMNHGKALPLHMRRKGLGSSGGIPMTAMEGKKKENMQMKLLDSVFKGGGRGSSGALRKSESIDMSMYHNLRTLEDVENALDRDQSMDSLKSHLVRTGTSSDDLDLDLKRKKKVGNFGLGISISQLKTAKNAMLEKREQMRKKSMTDLAKVAKDSEKKVDMKKLKEKMKREFREFADDIDLSLDAGVQVGGGEPVKKFSTIAIQYEEQEGVPRSSTSNISLTVVSVSVQCDDDDDDDEDGDRPASPVFSPLVTKKKMKVDENQFPNLSIRIPQGVERVSSVDKFKRSLENGSTPSPLSPIDIGMKSTGQQYDDTVFDSFVKERMEEMKPETGTMEIQAGVLMSDMSNQGVQTSKKDYEISNENITPTTIEFVKKLMRIDNVSREIQCDLIVVSFGTTDSTTQIPVPKTKSTAPTEEQGCQTPFKYVPDEVDTEVQTISTRVGIDEDEVERLMKEQAKLKVEYGNLTKKGDEYGSIDVEAPVIDNFMDEDDKENDFEISNTPLPFPMRNRMKKVDSVTISPLPPSQRKRKRKENWDSVEIELRVPGDDIFDIGMKRIKSFEVVGEEENDEEEEYGEIVPRTPLERNILEEKKKIADDAEKLRKEKLEEEERAKNDIIERMNELNEAREKQKEEERRRRRQLFEEEERLKKIRQKQQDEYEVMLKEQAESHSRLKANREEFQRAWSMNEDSWKEDGKKRAERRKREKEWSEKEIKFREKAERVKEQLENMKEEEKRRKEANAREEKRRMDSKSRDDRNRKRKEQVMKMQLLEVTKQKEIAERQINDILKRSSKLALMVTQNSLKRVNSIDFSCQSPSSWLMEERKKELRDKMTKVESDISLVKKFAEMNNKNIRKGKLKKVSSVDGVKEREQQQQNMKAKKKKRRRRRTATFESLDTPQLGKENSPKKTKRSRSRESTPRTTPRTSRQPEKNMMSTSTGTDTIIMMEKDIRRRARSMKTTSSLERIAEKIRKKTSEQPAESSSSLKPTIVYVEKKVSKVKTRTVAVSVKPEQRNVKFQVDLSDPEPDQRNVGIMTARKGDYYMTEKRWWVQEVRTVGTNTKDRSKENWYRISHTRNVGTYFSPPFRHATAQCIPSRGSVEVQAVCNTKEQVSQFPIAPPTFRDLPVQTSAMSYLKYKVIRTRDKFCQAELSKVRFRLLERIPSQELGFRRSWRERSIQTSSPPRRNCRSQTVVFQKFNMAIQANMDPRRVNARIQTEKSCLKNNGFYRSFSISKSCQCVDPSKVEEEQAAKVNSQRTQTISPSEQRQDRSIQTVFTLSRKMLRGTDAESREILRKYHSSRPTSSDDGGRISLESSYVSRQNVVIQKLTKKLRHQASLRSDAETKHQRQIQHMKEQYKVLLDARTDKLHKLRGELEKEKYMKEMSTKLERSNMQAARNKMKGLEEDKVRIRHDCEEKLRAQRSLYEKQMGEMKAFMLKKSSREESTYRAGLREMEKNQQDQRKKLFVAHQNQLEHFSKHNEVVKRMASDSNRLKTSLCDLEEQNALLRKRNAIQRDQNDKQMKQYNQTIRNLKERMRNNVNSSKSGLQQSEYRQKQVFELAERGVKSRVEEARVKWVISSKEKEKEWARAHQIQEKKMKKLTLTLKLERDSWEAREARYGKGRERMRTENERLKQLVLQKEVENKKLKEYFQKIKSNPGGGGGGGGTKNKRSNKILSPTWTQGRKRSTIPDLGGPGGMMMSTELNNSTLNSVIEGGGGNSMFPKISMAPQRSDFFEDDENMKRRRAMKAVSINNRREYSMKSSSQLKHEKGGPAPGRLVYGEFGKKGNMRRKKKDVSSFKLSGIQLDL